MREKLGSPPEMSAFRRFSGAREENELRTIDLRATYDNVRIASDRLSSSLRRISAPLSMASADGSGN